MTAERRLTVELASAVGAMVVGMLLTTYAAWTHTAILLAPASAVVLVGGAWGGNVLARRGVRLGDTLLGRSRSAKGDAA